MKIVLSYRFMYDTFSRLLVNLPLRNATKDEIHKFLLKLKHVAKQNILQFKK